MRRHQTRSPGPSIQTTTALLYLLTTLPTSLAQKNTKRGIAYLGDTHASDNALLLSPASPLSWYYNWSPYPNTAQLPSTSLEFIPLIHGLDEASSSRTAAALDALPETSTHLLSFNEPDGTTDSGGSSISPEDAAKSYIDNIAPLRTAKRTWNISHPATTGSPRGLDWLRSFNESCFALDAQNGCPLDFIALHWYGAFDGLASWLNTLDEFYNTNATRDPPLKLWVTEMALPKGDEEATAAMLNASLPYLDGEGVVERYAWFGAFRKGDANEWTGDGVSLFDDDGGLTGVGALYMGGEFKEGQKGKAPENGAAGGRGGVWGALCVAVVVMVCIS